jgi:hypothetical protein
MHQACTSDGGGRHLHRGERPKFSAPLSSDVPCPRGASIAPHWVRSREARMSVTLQYSFSRRNPCRCGQKCIHARYIRRASGSALASGQDRGVVIRAV